MMDASTRSGAPMQRLRRSLTIGCAAAAMAMGLALPSKAHAQAFQGTPGTAAGGVTYNRLNPLGAGTEVITVNTPQAVVNWTVDNANFLPQGNTAYFQGAAGNGNFAILNRIIPGGGGPIQLNGNVVSRISATNTAQGGTVAFYSPGGIIIGPNASFNVNRLVLSTVDIGYQTSGQWISPAGTIDFLNNVSGPTPGPITIQANATPGVPQINATPEGAYVLAVAPSITQAGFVRSNGAVAYVAARGASVTYNAGLFDIILSAGTAAATSIDHTGVTSGPASTGAADPHRIYMVTANDGAGFTQALISGTVGFDTPVSATVENGAIILSNGYDIVGDQAELPSFAIGPSSTSDITFLLATMTSDVTAWALNNAFVTDNNTFQQDLRLYAAQSITMSAGEGAVISVGGNLTLSSDVPLPSFTGNVDGGDIFISVDAGSNLFVAGTTLLEANGIARDQQEGFYGTGRGGNIDIFSSGTVNFAGGLTARANGVSPATDGFSDLGDRGFGGTVSLLAVGSGEIRTTALTIEAYARSGTASGVTSESLDALGGEVYLETLDGGQINVTGPTSIDVSAVGGSIGDFFGGTGGDGTGGFVSINVGGSGGGNILLTGATTINANGTGGNAENAGFGQGGQINVSSQADGLIRIGSGSSFTANGTGGNAQPGFDDAAGGFGTGGSISFVAGGFDSGGSIEVGNINLAVNGTGGNGAPGSDPDSVPQDGTDGGEGTGGSILIRAADDGGRIIMGAVTASADGQGGQGGLPNDTLGVDGGNGGTGTGGDIIVEIPDPSSSGPGPAAPGDGVIAMDSFFATANGTGGVASDGNGGDGNGGFVGLEVPVATMQFTNGVTLQAIGYGGTGNGLAGELPLSGAGNGGTTRITVTAGTLTAGGIVSMLADGNGGAVVSTGTAGDGNGGSAFFQLIGGGVVQVGGLDLAAVGNGGYTLSSLPFATQIGGFGQGGNATVELSDGGSLTVNGSVTVQAQGLGGRAGVAGGGTGGNALFTAAEAGTNFTISGTVLILADAVAGNPSPSPLTSVISGGDAQAGSARMTLSGGAVGTITSTSASALFLSASTRAPNSYTGATGAESTAGTAVLTVDGSGLSVTGTTFVVADSVAGAGTSGGTAAGGTAGITVFSGGTFNSGDMSVAANSFGGAATASGNGGNGFGGTAYIRANGGTITGTNGAGFNQLLALGRGGLSASGTGGTGSGGTADIQALGGTITYAGGFYGDVSGAGGNGAFGGDGIGGQLDVFTILGGTLAFNNSSFNEFFADGSGGTGLSGGGDGTGGQVAFEILVSSGPTPTDRISAGVISASASGFGGAASLSGAGGQGTGGTTQVLLPGGTFQVASDAAFTAAGIGGSSSSISGVGRGGTSQATISGGAFTIGGRATFEANGTGGLINGTGTGEQGLGGTAIFALRGGSAQVGSIAVTSIGTGSYALGASQPGQIGGVGSGSLSSIDVSGGASLTSTGEVFVSSAGFGGTAYVAGSGFGGIAGLSVSGTGSTANLGNTIVTAQGVAAGFTGPGFTGAVNSGGFGSGGQASLQVGTGATATIAAVDVNANAGAFASYAGSQGATASAGVVNVIVNGDLTVSGTMAVSASAIGGDGVSGGEGNGGNASLVVSNGALTADRVFVTVAGSGGTGTTGAGGDGNGGTASLINSSGTILAQGVGQSFLGAVGTGGASASGAGGNGFGGQTALNALGGTMTFAGGLNMTSQGTGGDGGTTGGQGIGGDLQANFEGDNLVQLGTNSTFSTVGAGGSGGSGEGGQGFARDIVFSVGNGTTLTSTGVVEFTAQSLSGNGAGPPAFAQGGNIDFDVLDGGEVAFAATSFGSSATAGVNAITGAAGVANAGDVTITSRGLLDLGDLTIIANGFGSSGNGGAVEVTSLGSSLVRYRTALIQALGTGPTAGGSIDISEMLGSAGSSIDARASGTIDVFNVNATGNLRFESVGAGDVLLSQVSTTGGSATVLANTGDIVVTLSINGDVTLNSLLGSVSTTFVNGQNVSITTTTGAINAANVSATGTFAATSTTGAITASAVQTGGTASFTTTGGAIDAQNLAIGSALTMSSGGGNLRLAASTVGGLATMDSAGGTLDAEDLDVGGATLTSGAGALTASNIAGIGDIRATGSTTLDATDLTSSGGAIFLTGGSGALNATGIAAFSFVQMSTTGGALTAQDVTTTTGEISGSSGTGTLTLTDATAGGDVILTSTTGAILASGINAGRNLTLTSAGGGANLNAIVAGGGVTGNTGGGSASISNIQATGGVAFQTGAGQLIATDLTAGGAVSLGGSTLTATRVRSNNAGVTLASLSGPLNANTINAATTVAATSAGGAISPTNVTAGGQLSANSNGGTLTLTNVQAGSIAAQNASTVDAADVTTSGDLSLSGTSFIALRVRSTAGSVTLATTGGQLIANQVTGATNVSLTSVGGGMNASDITATTGNVLIASGGTLNASNVTAGQNISFQTNGFAANIGSFNAGGQILGDTGNAAIDVLGNLTAGQVIDLETGGNLGISGTLSAATIRLTSRDINIRQGALVGTPNSNVFLTIASSGTQAVLGGTTSGPGWTLDQAEVGRIQGNSLVILAGLQNNVPNGPRADLLIRDLTVDATRIRNLGIDTVGVVRPTTPSNPSNPNPAPSNPSPGPTAVNGRGIIRVEGNLLLANASVAPSGATNTLTIGSGTNTLGGVEVVTPSGSVRVRGQNGAPAGQLVISAADIWVGSAALIDQLVADSNFAGRNDALLNNSGAVETRGYIEANAVTLFLTGSTLYVQNTGGPGDFAGITVGSGPLVISGGSPQSPADVFAFGRSVRPDGTVQTGNTFFNTIDFSGSYTADAQFNRCFIATRSCGGRETAPPPGDNVETPVEGTTSPPGFTPPPIIDFTAVAEPLIDEPVTSGGDSGIWIERMDDGTPTVTVDPPQGSNQNEDEDEEQEQPLGGPSQPVSTPGGRP